MGIRYLIFCIGALHSQSTDPRFRAVDCIAPKLTELISDTLYDRNKRQCKCSSVPATDWNEQTKAEEWRAAWADCVNAVLEKQHIDERIDHRSYERQGIDQIPTVHLGAAVSQMEKRGICTERGNLNREIEVTKQRLR